MGTNAAPLEGLEVVVLVVERLGGGGLREDRVRLLDDELVLGVEVVVDVLDEA